MGLAAPLFLLGLLAIALPFWLHRLQTKSSNRRAFSSAMLLETTEQQVHVEKKLKHLLLLALRVALLTLLAAAFAKPFLDRVIPLAESGSAGTHIVVLDASASMGRSGAYSQAQDLAGDLLGAAPQDALVQAVVADGQVRVAAAASLARDEHRRAIENSAPSAERLAYGALIEQTERLAANAVPPVTLHLVSDFQASATPAQFADLIADGVAAFTPHRVGTGEPVNWWVETVQTSPTAIDVVVMNQSSVDRTADVSLEIDGAAIDTRSVVGPGRHAIRFDDLALETGEHPFTVSVATDDDLAADNRWFGVIVIEPPSTVPVITANVDGLPLTYLRAAIESFVGAPYEVLPLLVGDFDPRVLTRHRWVIVDDIGSVDALLEDALTDFVLSGGSLLAFTGDGSRGMSSLPVAGLEVAPANLGTGVDRFATIGQLDLGHPALSGTDGWHRVNVTQTTAVSMTAAEEPLIRLDNGEPLLIEQNRGDGRVLLLLSALDNRWNDLPVHPVFVGFMFETARYLSGRVNTQKHYITGDALPLSLIGGGAGQVIDPEGETVLSLADTANAQMIRLNKPGIYAVYTAMGETRVAANIDPLESDLATMPAELLDRWQDLTVDATPAGAPQSGGDRNDPLALWPWVLLFLAVVVIAESALGNLHIATMKRSKA